MKWTSCILAAIAFTFSASVAMNAQNPSPAEIQQIAERAYLYAYPMVLLQTTMAVFPVNRLIHVAEFPNASFRLIVRPNADTLYTNAWINLEKEPMLLHVPDSGGRFYLLQFMDSWTETFADPGKRTTGTGETWFACRAGLAWRASSARHTARRADKPGVAARANADQRRGGLRQCSRLPVRHATGSAEPISGSG